MSSSDGQQDVRVLLGYDWIAGCLEMDDFIMEQPDEFFHELEMFRSLNKDLCVHMDSAGSFEDNLPNSLLPPNKDDLRAEKETHQCTFCYKINSRLFPVPSFQECCIVCKKHKSTHPHTLRDPAVVRVNFPASKILPSYKHKIPQRRSFDPGDSFGLPSHCLLGQSYAIRRKVPNIDNIDLRSNLKKKNFTGFENKGMNPSEPKESGSLHPDQITRLPRFNLKHFGPKKRL
ncbi:migration and invasion-inhibitory protein [Thalassophryne amazonica]|uniref:migration and invasion-inhibitory protein n=1 Tax=Thalassophryne amazonica TaxID=390379 RepID=UPI0014720328|nr:migration and invasion-inhibitory protein [Thalassophryne amazonica]